MKLYKWIAIGIAIIVLTLPLAGCVAKSEHETLQANYEALQEENTVMQTELEAVRTELSSLQIDYNELEASNKVITEELAEIKKVYPIKRFPDAETLETWLAEQPNPPISSDAILWLSHGLQLQEAALSSGYIINVEYTTEDSVYYTTICTAILEDNSFYWWNPETDEIYYWLDIKHH